MFARDITTVLHYLGAITGRQGEHLVCSFPGIKVIMELEATVDL
jgi:hypothetical protein